MSLNINCKATDNFYRYKMDKIKISQTGRGGNCHTILDNIEIISTQINTNADLLLNYIGGLLGCNTKKENGYILKGHYDASKIQESIYNFINFASLCKKCTIPELTPTITKQGKKTLLIMKCSACGESYELIGNNKNNDKLLDNMIKYYTNNEFVANKGSMVVLKSNDNFNPF
jgi:translation initiation factor 2 beta subunit (eIF-2beta)/eIF-5